VPLTFGVVGFVKEYLPQNFLVAPRSGRREISVLKAPHNRIDVEVARDVQHQGFSPTGLIVKWEIASRSVGDDDDFPVAEIAEA
jgi:hypothetical protein